MEFKILKYVMEPNCVKWLKENVGVGVIQNTPITENEQIFVHLTFSNLMSEGDRLLILEHFPDAQNCSQMAEEISGIDLGFPTFLITRTSRKEVLHILTGLGGTIVNSVCAKNELPDLEESWERMANVKAHLGGRPLTELSVKEIGDMYRRLYYPNPE